MSEFLFVDLASDVRAKLLLHAVRNVRALGGPGSGNFGHSGRPGQQGGSGEGGDEGAAPKDTQDVTTPTTHWPVDDGTVRAQGLYYPNQVQKHYDDWAGDLSDTEQKAIAAYTGDDYHEINGVLRGEIEKDGKQVSERALLRIKAIDNAIARAPQPPPPELVWRGLSVPKRVLEDMQPGAEIELGGYQSTSLDPRFASTWARSGPLLEIKPKAGAYVAKLSQNSDEKEFLLPHESKFRVVGVSTVKIVRLSFGSPDNAFERTVVKLEQI